MHGIAIGDEGQLTSTAIVGANSRLGASGRSRSLLAESQWMIDPRNTLFARVEFVQKSAEDLALTPVFAGSALFDVGSASLGYVREFAHIGGATIGIGAAASVYFVPSALESFYGSRAPVGGLAFLRVRTAKGAMAGMPGM
jgi:S1-C subfamily serine protease